MIPLAQYFASNGSGEDFTPMAAVPTRKAVQRPAASVQRPVASAAAPRPAAPRPAVAQRPSTAATRPGTPAQKPAAASPLREQALLREAEGVTLLTNGHEGAARQPKAVAQRPLDTVSPRVMTEPRIALRIVEAERAAWADEREAHAEELAEAVAKAREEGIEIGRRLGGEDAEGSLASRIEALRAELSETHATELSSSRRTWTEEQGDRLADLMVLQMAILEETIKVSLSSVLRPLALDARRRQTLEELVGAVKTIALDGAAYKIAASGPQDLLTDLRGKLGDHARLISFEADETQPDLRIDADNTVIESRLSSWRLALEEALS
ncbi:MULTISPECIES: hypothetical protein [unclassified Aureimonas]|uniref:hypothetical protein n=1 Tax=unclassified Aureimonas TaxID=2615206 RepID=UPI0006FC050F|nr:MULTISPECIES: hypothetical protein [unclassified Aureimonas]KQT66079.1 hypothetical protein ASG62_19910 [Aureimonas sp. Leaf427]KQT81057.1 hypothetical protein ASG54_06340 [Aureimonas sp. Leaf460]